MIHGFSGGPHNFHYLGGRLADSGILACAFALDGHVDPAEAMARRRLGAGWARRWQEQTAQALATLADWTQGQYLVGLSMGALLAILLAAQNSRFPGLKGLVLLATPFRIASQKMRLPVRWLSLLAPNRLVKIKESVDILADDSRKAAYFRTHMTVGAIESLFRLQAQAEPALGRMALPVLAVHAVHDHTAPYSNLARVQRLLAGKPLTAVTLQRSYHVISDDVEREAVAQAVLDFIRST
jgi:carboxylesterase